MLREFMIATYLLVFKIAFQIGRLFPLRNKTVFVISFPGNIPLIIEKLAEQSLKEDIIVIQANKQPINLYVNSITKVIPLHHPIHFFQSIYHLATSRYIFVDNYYAFLSVTDFKEEVKCVQVWHAVGSMKLFGLNDLSNSSRTTKAIKRFKSVYNRFDFVVVGSKKMESIFTNSFAINDDGRFLRTGVPRTDFFFDDIKKKHAMQQFKVDFPLANNKKVILYAPTYREDQLGNSIISLQMDLNEMYKQLKSSHILLLRLHPAINNQFINKYPGFIFNVSEYDSINTLMVGSDILITDYSSIPFEFSLLNKPMIFYAYDIEQYAESRGIPNNYENMVPGPIAKTTKEIIKIIQQDEFDLNIVKQFAKEWNEYSTGQSTENLIHALYSLPVEDIEQIREHV